MPFMTASTACASAVMRCSSCRCSIAMSWSFPSRVQRSFATSRARKSCSPSRGRSAGHTRTRRKIQLEELLLLLLRMALPVLLFFFLARPVLGPTGLEQWLGTGGHSSQVVLIDDSVSMGYAAGEAPTFQRAQQAATALLGSVR